MTERCVCRESVEYSVEAVQLEARRTQLEYGQRLDSFRDGIAQGAKEVAARHLYLAGVYSASLDADLSGKPNDFSVIAALKHRLEIEGGTLLQFFGENSLAVNNQAQFVDVEHVLRGVLRDRQRAASLLEARIRLELNHAEASLDRLERLESFLASWRESVRLEALVGVDTILDMHDSQ